MQVTHGDKVPVCLKYEQTGEIPNISESCLYFSINDEPFIQSNMESG